MIYKLSPSDFTFLYEGCKRCYYLKVVHSISQPSVPLPAVFGKITGLLKNYYSGKRTEKLHAELPPGFVKYGEKYVKSRLIGLKGSNVRYFISGRFDITIEFDDGTYGLIDFKTGNPNDEYHALYSRQLHGYAYALEYPAPGALKLSPISKMGLLYFYPSKISQSTIEWISFDAKIHWIEIPKSEQGFLKFLKEVVGMLESPELPSPSPNCQWCKHVCDLQKKIRNV